MKEVIGKFGRVRKLSETEIEDENILGHFQEVLQRASGSVNDRAFQVKLEEAQEMDVEFACLRSMMNFCSWNKLIWKGERK